jgi:sucrose phosphorylase
MDTVAPGVALITETNVPHEDNISYFGNGCDEAHMVYNFALPPLVLHTFYRGDVTGLSKWAKNVKEPSKAATFFNMLDTHDGIGLMGVKGILPKEDIDFIVQSVKEHGALISYKMTADRTKEPYEMNSTWWSAINGDDCDEDISLQVKRYIASRSIALVLQGVPATYIHGAVGTPNDHNLAKKTGVNRDVNRGIIDSTVYAEALKDPRSKNSLLRKNNSRLMLIRTRQRSFHPHGSQRVVITSPSVFTVLRTSPEGDQHVLTMTNVTNNECTIEILLSELSLEENRWYDLVNEKEWNAEKSTLSITLQPYDVMWLKPLSEITQGEREDKEEEMS